MKERSNDICPYKPEKKNPAVISGNFSRFSCRYLKGPIGIFPVKKKVLLLIFFGKFRVKFHEISVRRIFNLNFFFNFSGNS